MTDTERPAERKRKGLPRPDKRRMLLRWEEAVEAQKALSEALDRLGRMLKDDTWNVSLTPRETP